MGVKSVVSIPVDTTDFDSFQGKFRTYLGELDKQQEKWERAGAAMGLSGEALAGGALNARDSLAVAAAQAGVISEAINKAVKAQNAFGGATKRAGDHMGKLHASVKGVSGAISSVAGWIIKIAAFGGLGGILSGLGVADLAGATFQRSRSAGRLGVSTGTLAAWNVDMQQFLGPGALEGAVAAQGDVTKGAALGALGIDPRAAQRMSPAALAYESASKALAIYQREKKSGAYLNDPRLLAYQNQLGGDIGDLRNLDQNGGQRALNAAYGNVLRDTHTLEINKRSEEAWDHLKITLDRVSMSIQTIFIDKLSGLAPEIDRLGGAFSNFISTVLSSSNMKDAINGLASGLHSLGDYMASSQFKSDLTNFGSEIHSIAEKLKWLLPKPETEADKKMWDIDNAQKKERWANIHRAWDSLVGSPGAATQFAKDQWSREMSVAHGLGTSAEIMRRKLAGDYAPSRIASLNQIASNKYKIPAGILDRLVMDESGYGRNLVSPAGALGPYQFMPDTAKGYGINALDTKQSANSAGRMLAGLFKKYHDWNKVIAAYNWGEYNLNRDIKKHGKDWLKYAPLETQGEVKQVVGANAPASNAAIARLLQVVMQKHTPKQAVVHVVNHTQARVVVQANAATHQ